MREQEVNAIIKLLNSKKTDMETGKEIEMNIGRAYNCFDDYARISKYIFDNLTKKGKDRLYMVWCVAGLDLSYYYRKVGCNPWDDRNKASMQFAYRNTGSIESMFNFLTDLKIDILSIDRTEMDDKLFNTWFRNFIWREKSIRVEDSEFAWLCGFATEWVNLHSTIKQSFYGGVCNGVIAEKNPNSFEKMCFPFI